MKTYIYRIDFVSNNGNDYGFEMVEALTADEAIKIFREYYEKGKYMISDVFRMIGKKSGIEAWKDR